MASGRVLSHLLRSTSLRLLKPAAFSSPRSPSPVHFSRPNSAGFLLSRAAQYATSDAAPPVKAPASPFAGPSGKITDEFTGAGAVGQVNGTEERVVWQRVLTGTPINLPMYSDSDDDSGDEDIYDIHVHYNLMSDGMYSDSDADSPKPDQVY